MGASLIPGLSYHTCVRVYMGTMVPEATVSVGKGNVIVSHIILWTRLFICEQDACFWGRGPHVRCAWLHNISSISVARQISNSVLFLIVFYWTLRAVLEILLYMSHFQRSYCICHILFLQLDFIYVNVSYFIVAIVLVRNDEIKLFNQINQFPLISPTRCDCGTALKYDIY